MDPFPVDQTSKYAERLTFRSKLQPPYQVVDRMAPPNLLYRLVAHELPRPSSIPMPRFCTIHLLRILPLSLLHSGRSEGPGSWKALGIPARTIDVQYALSPWQCVLRMHCSRVCVDSVNFGRRSEPGVTELGKQRGTYPVFTRWNIHRFSAERCAKWSFLSRVWLVKTVGVARCSGFRQESRSMRVGLASELPKRIGSVERNLPRIVAVSPKQQPFLLLGGFGTQNPCAPCL